MNKKEIFYKYTDFQILQGLGASWLSQIEGYMPIGDWLRNSALYYLSAQATHWQWLVWIPYWAIVLFLAVKFYIMVFLNWFVGKYGIKIGLLKAQQQYSAKKEHIAPFQVQINKTLDNIAKAVGAKSELDKL